MASTTGEAQRGKDIVAGFKKGTEKECISEADKVMKRNPKGIDRSHLVRACQLRALAAQAEAKRAKEQLKAAKVAKKEADKNAGKRSLLSKAKSKAKGAVEKAQAVKGKVAEKAKVVKESAKAAAETVRKGAGSGLIKAGKAVQPKTITRR